jgi:hypothetical protein
MIKVSKQSKQAILSHFMHEPIIKRKQMVIAEAVVKSSVEQSPRSRQILVNKFNK